jgi:hypothetical protein
VLDKINPALVKERARQLAEDGGFKQVLAVVKESILAEWALSPTHAEERRRELYFELQAIGRLERAIIALVDAGTLDARKEVKKKGK